MAARMYQQFPKSLIKEVVSIYASVPIGAAGAVQTLDPTRNMGIKSIVRQSAGLYLITLGVSNQPQIDKYNQLLAVSAVCIFAGISASPSVNVAVDAVHSLGQLSIQFSEAGSAVDPDSGSILKIEIKLKNSTSV